HRSTHYSTTRRSSDLFGEQGKMNRRDVEQARAEEQRAGFSAGAVQDREAGERGEADHRLPGPQQADEPRRDLVDLAVAERNFSGDRKSTRLNSSHVKI